MSIEQPPQQPKPFESFAINVSFRHEILRNVVGPAARHFVCFMVKFVSIRVHSWLIINDFAAA